MNDFCEFASAYGKMMILIAITNSKFCCQYAHPALNC